MQTIQWKISLLYVEDEKILRSVYERVLFPRVERLIMADHGEDGYQKYVENLPDLVITDIKMPVMNGLDMIRKIRKFNPNARVIIMSAYGESHYFMRAIENGVKSFLLKPVDNDKLLAVISEQAREIQLEQDIILEEQKRRKAENDLRNNEHILQAVSDIAEILLQLPFETETLNMVFAKLGKATGVSRVYYFECFTEDDFMYCRQTIEWAAEGITHQINNEGLLKVPLVNSSFERWAGVLGSRQPIYGLIRDFPADEQEVLTPQDILSVLAVPVFIDDVWEGFIGFDDCVEERIWTQAEINTLQVAANIMGAADKRSRIEKQLMELNADLEERVSHRTLQLQEEINERIQTEELLRDSEEKYRLIFEHANDGIFISGKEYIQFVNPKTCEITGYLPKSLIGKSLSEFIDPEYREMVLDVHYKKLKGEPAPVSYDVQIIDVNKRPKWVELKSNLIRWDDTKVVLTFMTDINTRKMFEEELKVLNQNLEERVRYELEQIQKQQKLLIQKSKLESLGELAAGIAHEINQPLGGLSMSLDNILFEQANKRLNDEYIQAKLKLMFEDIDRIKNIINHIRVFSRDQQESTNEVVSLVHVVNNALSLVNRLYINHRIDLVISLDRLHCQFLGNRIKMEQVILNILSNARFAVEKKALTAGAEFSKQIKIRSWGADGHLKLEIEDNGIGIDKDHLERIFDPFFSTKKDEDGTGLGLSISYGIVKEMAGNIEAQSIKNEYTRLTISLPEYKH